MSENNNKQFEEENFLFGKNKELPFEIPQGYFDMFSAKVMNRIEVQQEWEQYPVLAIITPSQTPQGGFTVPQNYFIENANLLEYKYELAAFNELSKIAKPRLKSLTEGYFETLSNRVLKRLEIAEEIKEYSKLSEIKKENVFAVKLDYFENISDNVKERYHSADQPKASVIEQVLNLLFKPKMAFAYGIALILGVGAFLFFNQPEKIIDSSDCKTLACLERKELLNERTLQNLNVDNLYELVDVDELDRQLSGSLQSDSLKNIDSLLEELE